MNELRVEQFAFVRFENFLASKGVAHGGDQARGQRGGGAEARFGHVTDEFVESGHSAEVGGVHWLADAFKIVPLGVEVVVSLKNERRVSRRGGAEVAEPNKGREDAVVQKEGLAPGELLDSYNVVSG